jgi:hypothetical protein
MDTTRRKFLALTCAATVLCCAGGISAAEDKGGELVQLTLDVQGMH